MGLLVLLKTFVQIGLACGVIKALSRFVFLANGGLGRAFELVTAVKEVAKRMELITHPDRFWASGLRATGQANAPIGGHAKAVEVVIAEGCKGTKGPGSGGEMASGR